MKGLNPGLLDSVAFFIDSTTGAGTVDAMTALDAEDSEVHWYRDQAWLVGVSVIKNENTAQLKDYVKITNNLWKQSEQLTIPILKDTALGGSGTYWLANPMRVQPDSDWTVQVETVTAAQDVVVVLHIWYGPLPRMLEGGISMVGYQKTLATGVAKTWKQGGTIVDLDPDSIYRIVGGVGMSATCMMIRVKCDSFEGASVIMLGQETSELGGMADITQFPYPMKFTGKETLIIDEFNIAADAALAHLLISEVSEGLTPQPRGGRQQAGPNIFTLGA